VLQFCGPCNALQLRLWPLPGCSRAALGAKQQKTVLIMMSNTGGGHKASAEALKQAFEETYGSKYRVSVAPGCVLAMSAPQCALRGVHGAVCERVPVLPLTRLPGACHCRRRARARLLHAPVHQVLVVDMWEQHTPAPFNQLPSSYSFLVQHGWLWRATYHMLNPPAVHLPYMSTIHMFTARQLHQAFDMWVRACSGVRLA
jgi:hypothetical protein